MKLVLRRPRKDKLLLDNASVNNFSCVRDLAGRFRFTINNECQAITVTFDNEKEIRDLAELLTRNLKK